MERQVSTIEGQRLDSQCDHSKDLTGLAWIQSADSSGQQQSHQRERFRYLPDSNALMAPDAHRMESFSYRNRRLTEARPSHTWELSISPTVRGPKYARRSAMSVGGSRCTVRDPLDKESQDRPSPRWRGRSLRAGQFLVQHGHPKHLSSGTANLYRYIAVSLLIRVMFSTCGVSHDEAVSWGAGKVWPILHSTVVRVVPLCPQRKQSTSPRHTRPLSRFSLE